jgi:hypothetical protein
MVWVWDSSSAEHAAGAVSVLSKFQKKMSDPSLGKLITNQTKTNWYPA